MTGVVAIYSRGGCPYAGGERRSFERTDVRGFGKLIRYNDFVTRYLVRLADGTELFTKGSEQGDDDQRWLRKLGRRLSVTMSATTARKVGFALAWMEVKTDSEEIEIREARIGEVPAFPAQGFIEMAVPPLDDRGIVLSAEDFDALTKRISNPPAPNEELRALFVERSSTRGSLIMATSALTRNDIEALLAECVARFERGADSQEDRDLARDCEIALRRPHGPGYLPPTDAEAALARARCMAAWNARQRKEER